MYQKNSLFNKIIKIEINFMKLLFIKHNRKTITKNNKIKFKLKNLNKKENLVILLILINNNQIINN